MLRRADLHTRLNGLAHVLPRGAIVRYETLYHPGIVQRVEMFRTPRIQTLSVSVDTFDGDRAVSVAAVTRSGRAVTAAAVLRADDSVECFFAGNRVAAAESPEATLRRLNEALEAWHDALDCGGSAAGWCKRHPGTLPIRDFDDFWKPVSGYVVV